LKEPLRIEHIESNHSFVLSADSGLPELLSFAGGGGKHAVKVGLTLSIEVGGREERAATGGLDYVDTHTYEKVRVVGPARKHESARGLAFHVPVEFQTDASPLQVSLVYRLNRFGPACSFGVSLPGEQQVIIRNVRLSLSLEFEKSSRSGEGTSDDEGGWRVTAPGNCLASGTPLEVVSSPIGISGIGGLRGASGLIHLEAVSGSSAVALWLDDDTEVPDLEMSGTSKRSISVGVVSNFAADLSGAQSNYVQLFSLDLSVPRWSTFPETFEGWFAGKPTGMVTGRNDL
jgi:hypothetical protein